VLVFFGTSEGVVKFTFKFKGILCTHKHHKNRIRDLVQSNLEKKSKKETTFLKKLNTR